MVANYVRDAATSNAAALVRAAAAGRRLRDVLDQAPSRAFDGNFDEGQVRAWVESWGQASLDLMRKELSSEIVSALAAELRRRRPDRAYASSTSSTSSSSSSASADPCSADPQRHEPPADEDAQPRDLPADVPEPQRQPRVGPAVRGPRGRLLTLDDAKLLHLSVANTATKVVHAVAVGPAQSEVMAEWHTFCGWRFGASRTAGVAQQGWRPCPYCPTL